jgi:uncharacterized SAM-binding protein YcdF (DUF218 family)
VPRSRTLVTGLVLAVILGWGAATARIVLFPAEDAPGRADAVVVLSGSKHARLDRGLELVRERVAPVLVISAGLDPDRPEAHRLCTAGRGDGFRVLCFEPNPDSTRGEAEAVGRLARQNDWRRVLLVTSRFHVTRARMIFDRCVDGDVDALGVTYPWWSVPAHVAGEWAKLAYASTFARGC